MKKYSIAALFILLLIYGDDVSAQQEAQFSHNMFNNMGINPGFAGLRSAICATALARQQWVGFRDGEGTRVNPETYGFNIDAPIPFLKGGLGLGFIQDQLGFETSLGVKLAYAYHLDLDYGTLGIGAQVGFLDKRIDFSNFNPIQDGDPALTGSAEESRMFIDFALGAFYMMDDKAWAGISVSQLSQQNREIGPSEHQLRRHIYFTAGYNYTLPSQPAFVLSPSVLFKTDLGSLQTDINTFITYNNRFWGGVSYRLDDAAVIFMGLTFEQISIGYSYDITISPLGRSGRSYGSHEVMLQYCFDLDIEKIKETHRNVRFL
jgi:type IX secretion system PorP/SprF family membrane protein